MSDPKDYNPFSNTELPSSSASATPAVNAYDAPGSSVQPSSLVQPSALVQPSSLVTPVGQDQYGQGAAPAQPMAAFDTPIANPYTAPIPEQSQYPQQGQYPGQPQYPNPSTPQYVGINAPGYGQPYGSPVTNSNATTAMVLGIVGLMFFPVIPSIIAIVLGTKAKREIRATGQGGQGMATAGQVMGWIALSFWIILGVLMAFGFLLLQS